VTELLAAGARFIGGCCGTNPDFIRAVRARLEQT
jgi:S-methylmethionine-dependent homocysteine/selenocysteine methylase